MGKIIVIVSGAGGAASLGFCRSLRESDINYELIGLDCNKYHLQLAETDYKYLIPSCKESGYINSINSIAKKHNADFLHVQPDQEIEILSERREELIVKTNFSKKRVVRDCINKYTSYWFWKLSRITVPKTLLVKNIQDLLKAFEVLGSKIWLRKIKGAGGKGSFLADSFDKALSWINICGGWEGFIASEYLSDKTITWQSIWNNGELIIAQTRLRKYWEFGAKTFSGVTGITGTGITISDDVVNDVAMNSIYAIDKVPHGIFSVDMAYDSKDIPNPTEINNSRFFTTHYFFTRAGLNFPDIFVRLSLGLDVDLPKLRVNPLENDLVWIRGMDHIPILTTIKDINKCMIN